MLTTVPVRMNEDTVQKIERIQQKVHAASRSDTVRRAIDISDILVNAVSKGEKIIIESKGGKRKQILITGLNNE